MMEITTVTLIVIASILGTLCSCFFMFYQLFYRKKHAEEHMDQYNKIVRTIDVVLYLLPPGDRKAMLGLMENDINKRYLQYVDPKVNA